MVANPAIRKPTLAIQNAARASPARPRVTVSFVNVALTLAGIAAIPAEIVSDGTDLWTISDGDVQN